MATPRTAAPLAIAVVAGFVLWYAAAIVGGRREAWDAGVYWVLFYPAAIALAAVLGHRYPERPWRWALALFWSQFLAMGIRSGELGSLWPLGLVAFGVVSLPAIVAANVAARRRRRATAGEA